MQGEYLYLKVKGNCMVPNICDSDTLIIKSVSEDSFKIKDIVAFKYKGNTFAHRILDIRRSNGTIFFTKGDRAFFIEPSVKYDDVLGKVIAVVKNNNLIEIRDIRLSFSDQLFFCLSRIYHYFKTRI